MKFLCPDLRRSGPILRRVQGMVSGEPPAWQRPMRGAHVPVILHLALGLAVGLAMPRFLNGWFHAAVELLR